MRWTPENENILWRTIFQTQNLALELDKVSQAWPGDDKPTPKAIKEKLDKYRRREPGTSTVTFSMGPKNATTATASPRKPRTSKKAAAAAIQDSFDATSASTSATAGAETGVGAGAGRGRGRPRKTPAPAPADTNTLESEPEPEPESSEPSSKRIKTEESLSAPSIEIQIPVSPGPVHIKSDPDKENVGPGPGFAFALKRKDVHKVKEPVPALRHGQHATTHENKGKKKSTHKKKSGNGKKVKVEDTEAFFRCGSVVDCKGECCGEPRCVYCFGEWDGDMA